MTDNKINKLVELAQKVKRAYEEWQQAEKDWGSILCSEKTSNAFNEYEKAEHELLGFCFETDF